MDAVHAHALVQLAGLLGGPLTLGLGISRMVTFSRGGGSTYRAARRHHRDDG